jgi:hypothetical protein
MLFFQGALFPVPDIRETASHHYTAFPVSPAAGRLNTFIAAGITMMAANPVTVTVKAMSPPHCAITGNSEKKRTRNPAITDAAFERIALPVPS